MKNWKETRVGDIGKVITGKTPKTSIDENYGGDIPFITPSDDMTTKYIFATNKKLTETGAQSVKNNVIPPNTICVSCIGSDLGKVVISTETSVTNQQINSIVLNENEYDLDFIYYVMTSLGKVMNHHSKTSTAVPIVNKTQFSDYTFMCPDLITQKKIGGVLASLDDKISNNRSINRNLEEQAFALFDSYFPNAMYGEKKIGDYISPSRGRALVTKDAVTGDIPVVAGGLSPSTYHNEANTVGPVLTISASGANAGYVGLWNQSVWSSDSSYIDSRMTNDVYFWYVMLKKRQKEIFDSQTGSAQPHIYPKHIEIMPVIDLDKDTIEDYTKEVTPMFNMIGINDKENLGLAVLRDSLLPKLMSGELDVSDLEL